MRDTVDVLIDTLKNTGMETLPQNVSQETPISLAIKMGNRNMALHLLRQHKDFLGHDLSPEFQEALFYGDWELLKELLDLIKKQTFCFQGDTGLLELMEYKNKLLMRICSVSHFQRQLCGGDSLKVTGLDLLRESFNYVDESGRTPLMASLRAGNSDYAWYILRLMQYDEDSQDSVDGFTDNIHSKDSCRHYLNTIDENGETALSEAIRQGDGIIVARLLELGVDIEWKATIPGIPSGR